jgi:hypothetical protein
VNHAAHHARGVLDRLATTELDVGPGKEHDLTAEFANADLEAHAGAGGRLRENQRPLLPGEHLRRRFAVLFQHAREIDDLFDLFLAEFFDGKEMVHGRACQKGQGLVKKVKTRRWNPARP